MSYYEDRKRALSMVDDLLAQGQTVIAIKHKISLTFGFSPKFVDDRVKHLTELRESQL